MASRAAIKSQKRSSEVLPIEPFPLKGFIFFAMRKTQEKLKILANEFMTYPPEKKKVIIKDTFENLQELLLSILKDKTDEAKSMLAEAIAKGEDLSVSKLV